jgi:hypothetical protein
MWCVWMALFVCAAVTPSSVNAQNGYTVTATVNPFFIDPVSGWDFTQGHPLSPADGLHRGADGWLYGTSLNRQNGGNALVIFRVNPATGTYTILYVLEVSRIDSDFLVPGPNGLLYLVVTDGGLAYYAPGQSAHFDNFCLYGCVLTIDTTNNAQLDQRYNFPRGPYYPSYFYGVDVDGAAYVDTIADDAYPPTCDVGPVYTKVTLDGDATHFCGELPDVAWYSHLGQIGDVFFSVSGQNVLQLDASTKTWVVLASIAPTDGAPRFLGTGSGYVYGVTDSGGALGGGVVFRIRVPSLPAPDLIVAALSDPPATSSPGQSFNASDTTRNDAAERAAGSVTTYYLSRTGEQGDIKLKNRYIPELGPLGESSGVMSLKIPESTPLGTYWLVACADRTSDVAENNNSNNCRKSTTTVLLSRPDLVAKSVTNPPGEARPGQAFAVMDTVANEGNAPALGSTTFYFLSLDAVRNAGDLLLSGSRQVPALLPTLASSGNATVTIPLSAPLATYYVLACADGAQKISESNESNNCVAAADRVAVSAPDLVTTFVANPPIDAWPGKSFTTADTVINQGNRPSPSSSTRYYLSLNLLRDVGDVLLSGTRAVPLLDPAEPSSSSRKVTVPTNTPLGLYYLLACADDKTAVPEVSETNNCRASSTMIRIAWPDLVTTAVGNPPSSVVAGQKFSVSDTVHNQGQATSLTSTTRYFLSLDTSRGGGDIMLVGTRDVIALTPGASSPGSRLVTVPSGTPPGAYFVLACADDLARTAESNNANNCMSSAGTLIVLPDSP